MKNSQAEKREPRVERGNQGGKGVWRKGDKIGVVGGVVGVGCGVLDKGVGGLEGGGAGDNTDSGGKGDAENVAEGNR